MAFDLSLYHVAVGDTVELVRKINSAMDATAAAVNGFVEAQVVAADEIDWSKDWHEKTLAENTTFTFANVNPDFVNAVTILLETAGHDVTWTAEVVWPFDAEPVWRAGIHFEITFKWVPSKGKYLASWLEYDL